MSARWRRTSKNRKWLDFNNLRNKKHIRPDNQRVKAIPMHTNFRPSKSFAKRKFEDPKPLIDIFQENGFHHNCG